MSRVKVPWALSQGYTGQGIVVAGQDTGYAWDHPALINAYRGYDPAAGSAKKTTTTDTTVFTTTSAIPIPAARTLAATTAPSRAITTATARNTMGTMAGNDLAPGSAGWPATAINAIGVAPGAKWIGCRNMDTGDGTLATYIECFEG